MTNRLLLWVELRALLKPASYFIVEIKNGAFLVDFYIDVLIIKAIPSLLQIQNYCCANKLLYLQDQFIFLDFSILNPI